MDKNLIIEKAKLYRDYTAKNLSAIIQVPGFSSTEKNRVELLSRLCREAGMEDVHTDGLGSLLGRVGNGKKKLVFDAHIDTVGVGDPAQWVTPPHSGLIKDGLVYGRGASDQLGGAASMITAPGSSRTWPTRRLHRLVLIYCYGRGLRRTLLEVSHRRRTLRPRFCGFDRTNILPALSWTSRTHGNPIDIKGRSCHGSAPERGDSAAYKAARAALAIEKLNTELKPDDDNFLGKGTITVSQIKVQGQASAPYPIKLCYIVIVG